MSPAGSSTARSDRRSNSSAVIMGGLVPFEVLRFFAFSCATDRDEADRFFMAIGHRGSPCGLRYLSNDVEAGLVCGPRGSFDAVLVQPECLRIDEVNTVRRFVGGSISRHRTRTAFSIETIPRWMSARPRDFVLAMHTVYE